MFAPAKIKVPAPSNQIIITAVLILQRWIHFSLFFTQKSEGAALQTFSADVRWT